jgi:hypothetical protein
VQGFLIALGSGVLLGGVWIVSVKPPTAPPAESTLFRVEETILVSHHLVHAQSAPSVRVIILSPQSDRPHPLMPLLSLSLAVRIVVKAWLLS